jgi:D-psicose/D-tagatose/L-ribulose 3-epimerase
MRLAVSNIAWEAEDELAVAAALESLGVGHVEIAPTKVFADPLATTAAERDAYLRFWAEREITIVAFQSMLFGHPGLRLFDGRESRERTVAVLSGFIELAGSLGVGRLVFGSPKNRRVPEGMDSPVALSIAVDVFSALAEVAEDNGTCLCIEPNPEAYDCNFVTTARSGLDLVRAVDRPGFGLHLDAAGMTLAGDDVEKSIAESRAELRHFHASAPFLGPLESEVVDHAAAGRALADIGYEGFLSIEMRPSPLGRDGAVANVVEAVRLARDAYDS